MSVSFTPMTITAANFSNIKSKLSNGIGFFKDNEFHYVVADGTFYRTDVVRRQTTIKFSDAIQKLPSMYKVVINGNYFSGSNLYAHASLGVVDPADVDSIGNVHAGGSIVLPDGGGGNRYFYFGRNNTVPPAYVNGFGNPPASLFEGMGGLGPLIITNPANGKPLRYGSGNRYASDPNKRTIPQTNDEWKDCIQRSNATYTSITAETVDGAGVCAIGYNDDNNIVIFLIKPHKKTGSLEEIRDKFWNIGLKKACFTDGSNSACMAVDRTMVPGLEPIYVKDNLIEVGFALYYYKTEPDQKFSIEFTMLEVLDDKYLWGEGEWTLNASVNGIPVQLLSKFPVTTGQKIPLTEKVSVEVKPSKSETLKILIYGKDTAGVTDDLGNVAHEFTQTSTPPWGVGSQEAVSTNKCYKIFYTINKIP